MENEEFKKPYYKRIQMHIVCGWIIWAMGAWATYADPEIGWPALREILVWLVFIPGIAAFFYFLGAIQDFYSTEA